MIISSIDGDDELARYLASYLADKKDNFIKIWYDADLHIIKSGINEDFLEETIKQFFNDLP